MTSSAPIVRTILEPVGHLADSNAQVRHPADHGTWIWHPEKAVTETGVLRFRLRFTLNSPATPLIHVTADQRFQLRCDGQDVTFGPDRCDLNHWTVQSVELDLSPGEHELEALVWYMAEPDNTPISADLAAPTSALAPMAQVTWHAGFLVFAEGVDAPLLNTGAAPWTVEDLTDALDMKHLAIPGAYLDIGPSFNFDLERWQTGDSKPAKAVLGPIPANRTGVRRPGRCLYAADLPEQQRQAWTGGKIRAVRLSWDETPVEAAETNAPEIVIWQDLINNGKQLTIPAHSECTVLWDLENYYCGYPLTKAEGGEGSLIQWNWAESLYEESSLEKVSGFTHKGNRGEILNKVFLGIQDSWLVGSQKTETPALWWRCGRYIRVRVKTAASPLTITHVGMITTGFPLGPAGSWKSSDTTWDRLMPIFARAFQASGHETWTDTPYYEQMCYVGDNVLTCLANYAWFRDARLSRRSLELYDWSRLGSGFVAERYPSGWRQECLTFSLFWPMMVRDYAWWRDDVAFVKSMLPGIRSVLAEFDGLASDGLLQKIPGWPFIDWVPEWSSGEGCGPGVREGDSSIVNLQWVLSLLATAQLEETYGEPLFAQRNRQLAHRLFDLILARYWDANRGLLLDTHGQSFASEHAQMFALLSGLLDAEKTKSCLDAMRKGDGLAKATIYSSFYVLDVLYRHGESDEFHRRLDPWRSLYDMGFTSTPEQPEPTRSDAHAWGAHPAWHSMASIAGVRPSAPSFRTVRVAPCPGTLEYVQCSVVHPQGTVEVDLRFAAGKASGTITLPDGITGDFVWDGASRELKPGLNPI